MPIEKLQKLILAALEDYKALDVTSLDIRELTNIADTMVICTGTSKRHVQSIADNLMTVAKAEGIQPLGIEGEKFGEWVLVDLGDIVVHIMLKQTRELYSLEKLWLTAKEFRKANAD